LAPRGLALPCCDRERQAACWKEPCAGCPTSGQPHILSRCVPKSLVIVFRKVGP
jgi:hypothetical protein